MKKSKVAIFLSVIAAGICFLHGQWLLRLIVNPPRLVPAFALPVGGLGFLGFFAGVAGAKLASKQRSYYLTVVCMGLPLPEGFLVLGYGGWGSDTFFLSGVLIIVCATAAAALTITSASEFGE